MTEAERENERERGRERNLKIYTTGLEDEGITRQEIHLEAAKAQG